MKERFVRGFVEISLDRCEHMVVTKWDICGSRRDLWI
jgi:hypothetical protein